MATASHTSDQASDSSGLKQRLDLTSKRLDLTSKIASIPVVPDGFHDEQDRLRASAEVGWRHQIFSKSVGGVTRVDQCRFATWQYAREPIDAKRQKVVVEAVAEWATSAAERLKSRESLVLFGPCGTGKDHLQIAACNQAVIQSGVSAIWVNCRQLMSRARDAIASSDTERSMMAELEAVDVLVLSDPLPVTGELSWYQADMLYRIVENRGEAGKVTNVTLNVADDEEADRRLGVATWDRICHRAWKIECAWPSHRQPSRVV